jgi:hypothetical protein
MTYREFIFECKHNHRTKSWQWNTVPRIPCNTKGCRAKAYRTISNLHKISAEPTVYYKSPDGKLFMPGDPNPHYIPKGATRHEIRTFRDRDRFYKEMNLHEKMEHERQSEYEDSTFGEMRRQERSDLFHEMSSMSNYGKAVARAAIEKSNRRDCDYESGVHLTGWEYDRGNR